MQLEANCQVLLFNSVTSKYIRIEMKSSSFSVCLSKGVIILQYNVFFSFQLPLYYSLIKSD